MSKYDEWNAILDRLYSHAKEPKCNPAPNTQEIAESSFDFEKIAFERLKIRLEQSKISIREYYRLCGLLYSLRKGESRRLLAALMRRFPVKSDGQRVWIAERR